MVQKISQGDIFGRIGTGFGQGLADQLPKEIERNRLSSGLAQFEQDYQNLSPMQQMARLSSIPGITPQMLSSMGELAKQGNLRSAYERAAGMGEPGMRRGQPMPPGYQGQMEERGAPGMEGRPYEEGGEPRGMEQEPRREPQREDRKPIAENPLSPERIPKARWPTEKKMAVIKGYNDLNFPPDVSLRLADEDEAKDLATPKDYEEQLATYGKAVSEVKNALDESMRQKLQVEPGAPLKNLTGTMVGNFEKGIKRDLRLNPGSSLEDAVEKWAGKALRLDKDIGRMKTLATTTGVEAGRNDELLKKLESYQRIFEETGNQEQFYDFLKSEFQFSPHAAAAIAYPRTKGAQEYISKYQGPHYKIGRHGRQPDFEKMEPYARKAANDILKVITQNDSLLAIYKDLKSKDPDFDERSFFDELELNRDKLNDAQKSELTVRGENIFGNWSDRWYLPWFKKK